MAHTDSQPLTLRRILLVALTGVGAGFSLEWVGASSSCQP